MEINEARKRYFDHLAFQIIKLKENQEFPQDFLYSLDFFDLDLYQNPEINWNTTIETAIKNLEDLKEIVINRISETINSFDFQKEKGSLDFDSIDLEFESETGINLSDDTNFFLEDFIRKRYKPKIKWIEKNLEVLKKCEDFYLKYGEEPPYAYPLNKFEKIPFFGGLNEFAVFFNLLEETGNFFITDRSNLKYHLSNYKNVDSESIADINVENAIIKLKANKIEKNDFLKVLAKNFVLIDIKGKNLTELVPSIEESDINTKTLIQKSTPALAQEISDITFENFLQGFERIIKNLKIVRKKRSEKKEREWLEREKTKNKK